MSLRHLRSLPSKLEYDLQDQPTLADSAVATGNRLAIEQISKEEHLWLYRMHPELLPKSLQRLMRMHSTAKDLERKKYYLVTVNFLPGVNLNLLRACYHGWISKKFVEPIALQWENYTEEGCESHPHFHALCYNTTNKADFIRRTFRAFHDVLPEKESVDVKPIMVKDYQNTLTYVLKNRPKDVEWRQEVHLPHIIPEEKDVKKNSLKRCSIT